MLSEAEIAPIDLKVTWTWDLGLQYVNRPLAQDILHISNSLCTSASVKFNIQKHTSSGSPMQDVQRMISTTPAAAYHITFEVCCRTMVGSTLHMLHRD